MTELSEKFLKRMQERLGESYPAFLNTYERPPYRGLRVNTLKLSKEEFCGIAPFPLGEQVKNVADGFYIEEDRPGADVYHFAGLYYLQEPSAMQAAAMAASCPKRRVLDLCAAPGGKTAQIAAQMAGEGVLISNEIDYKRAKILSENVERMGIKNCAVVSASPETLAEKFPAYFDLILVDAPCSGEGMFKKEQNAVLEWSEENVAMCAKRQKKILECAAEMPEEGGHIVYSTCTFAEEEDEWQIADFLKEHPAFALVREEKLYPHTFRGEGHFVAVLKKLPACPSQSRAGTGEGARRKPFPIQKNGAGEKAFTAFCRDFFEDGTEMAGRIHMLSDGRMYLVPEGMPDLAGVRLLRLGVELGEWDGKLFKPAHALAMAYGQAAKRKIPLTREQARDYLRGEILTADVENGWVVVCADGYPLGLGKAVNGTVKNHYPKPLRLRT